MGSYALKRFFQRGISCPAAAIDASLDRTQSAYGSSANVAKLASKDIAVTLEEPHGDAPPFAESESDDQIEERILGVKEQTHCRPVRSSSQEACLS